MVSFQRLLLLVGFFLVYDRCQAQEGTCEDPVNLNPGDPVEEFSTFRSLPTFTCRPDGNLDFTPARWFAITGRGGLLTASLCNSATDTLWSIRVINNSENVCGNGAAYLCIGGGRDNDAGCFFTGVSSQVTWRARPGVRYYVVVGVDGDDEVFNGSFGLTITENEEDLCVDSPRQSLTVDGRFVTGMVTDRYTDNDFVFGPPCLGTGSRNPELEGFHPEDPGALYKVTASEFGELVVSTCSSSTEMETRLQVYTGACNRRVCEVSNGVRVNFDGLEYRISSRSEDSNCNVALGATASAATIRFRSSPGTDYFIFVGGTADTPTGTFGVGVLQTVIPNDQCIQAQALALGETISVVMDKDEGIFGSTRADSFEDEYGTFNVPSCLADADDAAVWYSVTGTGGTLWVFLPCGGPSNTDPLIVPTVDITVFSGSCDSLACVPTVEKNIECFAESLKGVEWDSDPGTVYSILLSAGTPNPIYSGVLSVSAEQTGAGSPSDSALKTTLNMLPLCISVWTWFLVNL